MTETSSCGFGGDGGGGKAWPSPWSGKGFLPSRETRLYRLGRVHDDGAAWERAAARIPALLLGGGDAVATAVAGLPEFPLQDVLASGSDVCVWRAMAVLAFLTHAFVWADGAANPRATLPSKLAVPLCQTAKYLDVQPVLSYAVYNLTNFAFINAADDDDIDDDEKEESARIEPTLGSVYSPLCFNGGRDEMWFRAVHVAIEARFGTCLVDVAPMRQAIIESDTKTIVSCLRALSSCLAAMEALLMRMDEGCDPYIYYHRVRQPMSGWRGNPLLPNGLVYEGVGDTGNNVTMMIYGETGAQSAIIPAVDALLGIEHQAGTWLTDYLRDMREMMPRQHRHFLQELEAQTSVRPFIEVCKQDDRECCREVVDEYNQALDALQSFRGTHRDFAYRYISQFGKAASANGSGDASGAAERGTGGTDFLPYLGAHRQTTIKHKL